MDPRTQAELAQQQAEQLVSQTSAAASPEQQQAAAEHRIRQQQAYESSPSHQASLAKAAQREQEKAQQTAAEGYYRSQGIPTWTGADGQIYADEYKAAQQAARQQEQAQKEQERATKAAATLSAHQQRAEAIRSGRKHTTNPVDGTPIYLESEDQLKQRRAGEMEKTRRSDIDRQIAAAEAEHESSMASNLQQGSKPLTESARVKLSKEQQRAHEAAVLALQGRYQTQSTATDKAGWWDMVNNNPTPEAQAAKANAERLSQPDAQLTEEDLAALSADPGTQPLVAKLQNIQKLLGKDDEIQKLKADHAARVADLKLRRDAPDKWAATVQERRSKMTPDELQKELETSAQSIQQRQQDLEQQAAELNAQVAAHTQQLDALSQQAAQRRSQGIPAGDLVSYQSPDGTTEAWPRDLATQREQVLARLQDTQAQQAPAWMKLEAQHTALKSEAEMHDASARLLQQAAQQQNAAAQQEHEQKRAAAVQSLSFTPGLEDTAKELESIDAEHATRLADLNATWDGQPPPAAVQALQQDVEQKHQSALAMGEARRLAAQSAYAGIIRQVQEYQSDPKKPGDVGDLWINARKNLAEALQIPEAKAMQLLEDVEAESDWDKILGRFNESTPSEEWKSWRNATKDDSDPRQTRILSNGGIAVNPTITDEAKYKAAVEAAKASPEAKAAALARYPLIRQQKGQEVLDTFQELAGTLGKDSVKDWEIFAKQRPKDVSEQDWAFQFAEKLKANTASSPVSSLIKRVFRAGTQGLYDLRQQASGFVAGITGSETAMQDAQWAGRKAAAIDAQKQLEGNVGSNFISRGAFDQLPRLAGSILPAAAGARVAQTGIRLLASTSLGARLFPSLAAALESAATPAQGVKAVQTLTRAGLGGTAAAGGIQTYGSQLAEIYGTLRKENPDLTHQQALSAAQQPALLSAAVTALLTTAGGAHGVEKLLINPTAAKALFKKQFTSQLQRAGFLGVSFAEGAAKEWLEEIPDELFSQYQAAVASHPHDPQAGIKSVAQFMKQLPELSVAIGLMGGGGESLSDFSSSSVQRPSTTPLHLRPETQSAAQAAIESYISALPPEQQDAVKNRTSIALHIAQGGDMQDLALNEKLLNDAGWTGRDSKGVQLPPGKLERLKDYTGPEVFSLDAEGRPIISPDYRARLQSEIPAAYHAIPESATKPAPTSPAKPDSGAAPTGQAPAPGSVTDADSGPVQAPAQPGAESPSGGNPPAQPGPAVAAASSTSTAVPTTQESIATFLQERGMPAAESTQAAAAIAAHPSMQGKDFTWYKQEPTKRAAIHDSLGITGSQNSKEKDTHPLRYPAATATTSAATAAPSGSDVATPGRTSERSVPTTLQQELTDAQTRLDDSIPGTPEHTLLQTLVTDLQQRIASSETVPVATTPEGSPAEGSADTPVRSVSESEKPSQTTANNSQPPQTTSPAAFDPKEINRALHAKELTDSQAARLVQRHTGATTVKDLVAGLQHHLGWTNYQRALTAAAVTLEDKSASSIPLASAERTAAEGSASRASARQTAEGSPQGGDGNRPINTPVRSGSVSDKPPSTTVNAAQQPQPLSTAPSSLSQNTAWSRAKLAALTSLKDPAKRAWARQFFATIEHGFEQHHALYDAIGIGPYSKTLLDGQMTAVVTLGGKVTRLFDFAAMLQQFDYLADPRAAALATGIEEDVHGAALRLAQLDPAKYGFDALVAQWDALPETLRQTVWQAYHAAKHTEKQKSTLPSSLSAKQRWHLMQEFLRMLVQDRHFQGQITEATDASPTLLQWVKDFLKDLSSLLKRLLTGLPDTQRQHIETLRDQIAATLTSIRAQSQSSTARLESLPTLRSPAATAYQTLSSLAAEEPMFSPAALARVFDALPPSLQSQTFEAWQQWQETDPTLASRTAQPPAKPGPSPLTSPVQYLQEVQKKGLNLPPPAPKADLMRHLLSQMVADPSLATALLLEAEKPATTSLFQRLLQKLASLTSGSDVGTPARTSGSDSGKPSQTTTTAGATTLRQTHTATLRALGGLQGVLFVQRLSPAKQQLFAQALSPQPPSTTVNGSAATLQPSSTPARDGAADMLAALAEREQDHLDSRTPEAALKLREKLRQQEIAQNRRLFFSQDSTSGTSGQPPSTTVNVAEGNLQPPQTPRRDRGEDMLAALEAHEAAIERDHLQASTPQAAALLRTKLGLQRVARNRARFFLQDKAARELHAAEQAGRQDLPRAQSLLALGSGLIGARRPARDWRTLGWSERRQLALLGIGVDQHPTEDAGGYPYSLSRLESALARVEFSLEGTPERQQALEELAWMQQQPAAYQTALDDLSPAYVERGIPIIKQSALDDLSLSYPHTAALIRPEYEARQSFGLRTDARLPAVRSAVVPIAPAQETTSQQDDLPVNPTENPSPFQSSTTPSAGPSSGSSLQTTANNSKPPPTTANAAQPLSFPIPLSKRGQIRRSTFPDADSLAAFQFKLDADTVASARSSAADVKKAEQRGLALLARLMEDSPLGRAELERRLLAYHIAVVQQAEAASAFGTFSPPSFASFAQSETSDTSPSTLPPPVGGDILSGMQAQGIRRLGPPDDSDGWAWYRALQADAAASKLKNAEAQRLARAGDIADPKALLAWINSNVVSTTSGRSIDEAATELRESEDQQFPVQSGEELGQSILAALTARQRAKEASSRNGGIPDPSESETTSSLEDFTAYAAGVPGQPFTAAELAKDLSVDDEIQVGSEWLTVQEADPATGSLTLDSSRFGSVTLPPDQILHLTDGPNHLRLQSSGNSGQQPSTTANNRQPLQTAPEALIRALPPGTQRDIFKPSPLETTLRPADAPPVSPADTAALDEDLRASIAAGNALDDSAPHLDSLDLEDTLADQADAFLDGNDESTGQPVPASPRVIHPLALPRSSDTLPPDEQLRSPAHILASLFPGSVRRAHAGADVRADRPQRGEPRPAVGGRPADFARLLAWAGEHGRMARFEEVQLALADKPLHAGGEHLVIANVLNGRLYKFTKPGLFGAQALDGPAYLERLALSNRLFRDALRFEGFITFPGESEPRAFISQPFYAAADPTRPDASMPRILDWLQSKGWHSFEGYFVHPHLGLQLWDIQTPGNVLEVPVSAAHPDGLMPVDLQLEPADPTRLRTLREQIRQGPRTPLFAAQRTPTRTGDIPVPSGNSGSTLETTANNSQQPQTTANTGEASPQPSQTAASRLDAAASLTHPLPSLAQKLAGNYPKGKVTLHGLPISIENPRGSERSGRTQDGQEWSITLPHHYGYLLGTTGKDKDHLDVFIGPDPDSPFVLIINQRKPPTEPSAAKKTKNPIPPPPIGGSSSDSLRLFAANPSGSERSESSVARRAKDGFDEHKIMLGFPDAPSALRGYMASYTPGWKGLSSAVPTTIPALKAWLASGDTTQPVTRAQFAALEQSQPTAGDPTPLPASLRTLDDITARAADKLGEGLEKLVRASVSKVGPAVRPLIKPVVELDKRLGQNAVTDKAATLLSKAADTTGTAGQFLVPTLTKASLAVPYAIGTTAQFLHLAQPFQILGFKGLDKRIASGLARVFGPTIKSAKAAAEAWLNKPDGISPTAKGLVDQLLPTALLPREWLALKHEMDRKSAFGAERANDLIRALSGNPRLSDLAYPKEFATNPLYRTQLFDAMEGRLPMASLPPEMQQLAQRLRSLLRDTGLELVRQGMMNPDTFEELQSSGWMPRYTEDEALATGGSFLAAFKLGVRDLLQQRSTAYHIVDTSRRGPDGQFLTVNRQEGGSGRNRWRFRDAAARDAYYHAFVRQQALAMLQERGNPQVRTMLASLGDQQSVREIRQQIASLTPESLDLPETLSPALAGIVKQAKKLTYQRFAPRDPFIPEKLIKDPVYAVARYVLGQTHNAATMELMRATAQNPDWVTDVDAQGFQKIPDSTRFGPLAGRFVRNDIARQVLDLADVPNAALAFYDGILRKWKAGKLVWNPGSHIRDAVGNTVFAYLGGSSIWNPGNWQYYRQALELHRTGSTDGDAGTPARSGSATTYAELLEHGVLGGDAYSGLVKERLKGLLPDTRTIEDFNPGLLMRSLMGLGSKLHGTHEFLTELRRFPDDFYKTAAYLKAKAEFSQQPQTTANNGQPLQTPAQQAAQHVRKWFPYYDRLGSSATTKAAGRFVNPFLSFFRESTRILGTAAVERPLALSAALAFPAAITSLSAMLLGLSDRDRDDIQKDLSGRGKGILGLGDAHLFSMLLPVRSADGAVQQWDISAVMPFADLLGQKVVPLEEKENAWQTFWRQMVSAGPAGGLIVSWVNNRDTFSGRHLVENDMPISEKASIIAQHALGVLAPPLAPDALAAVGIGQGGPLSKAGERQANKTLQTYDTFQTILRSVVGINVKSASPNSYREAEDFRKAQGYEVNPGFDYGTTVTSRVKRLLVRELAQDEPNREAIKNLVRRLKDLGVPLDTPKQIDTVLKIIDPAQQINGNPKHGVSAQEARRHFRETRGPESRRLYEASLILYDKIRARAPLLLRQ